MKPAYMDHAAATPVRPEVLAAMLPFFAERFGNPSAVYDLGSAIKAVMEEQRGKVARSSALTPTRLSLPPPAPKPITWPSRAWRWLPFRREANT